MWSADKVMALVPASQALQRMALATVMALGATGPLVSEARADDALVWARNKTKIEAEHWQTGRDGKWQRVKPLPELTLVGAAGVQTLVMTPVKVKHVDCTCARGKGDDIPEESKIPAKCKKSVAVQVPAIRMGKKLVPLIKPAGSGKDEAGEHEGPATDILGVVGPYLLLSVHDWSYACGAAHGSASAEFVVWDADKAAPTEWGEETERKVLAERLGVRAAAYIRGEAGDDNTNDDENPEMRISALRVGWSSTSLSLQMLMTMGWHYAGGDSVWGSYSRSKWIDATPGLYPNRWKDFAKLPDTAQGLVEANPDAAQIRLLTPAEAAQLAGTAARPGAGAGGRPPRAGK